jgi:hypothetical protein
MLPVGLIELMIVRMKEVVEESRFLWKAVGKYGHLRYYHQHLGSNWNVERNRTSRRLNLQNMCFSGLHALALELLGLQPVYVSYEW